MSAELKPCPFCAARAEFDNDDHGYVWVVCTGCGVTSDTDRHTDEDARTRLAAAWNRRAAPVSADRVEGECELFEKWARKDIGMPDSLPFNWDADWVKAAWEGWQAAIAADRASREAAAIALRDLLPREHSSAKATPQPDQARFAGEADSASIDGQLTGAHSEIKQGARSDDEPKLPEPEGTYAELDDFGNVVSHPSGDYTEKQMLSYARTYHAHMMRKLGGSVVVKVERNRVWIVSGNQSFMLAYEADTAEELNWYADRLRTALSAITPDVKLDGAESVDTPESMAASNARHAIDGAIQFGRENRNPPPSTEHWLYEYWNIGRQLAKLGETGWDNVTPLAPKCRDDDRCQYAIDHGAEGLGHCPAGKCCMPRGGSVEGIDLDMLQALAKDATPGPWTYCPMTETEDPEIGAMNGSRVAALVSADITKQNSRFIAAANPSSVLKLIAAARRAASGGRDGEARTDAQIVQQTEELAAELARYDGFALTAGTFRESASPTAIAYWKRACIAQELLTNTDPMDAAVELIDQQEAVAPLADEQANEQVGGGQ